MSKRTRMTQKDVDLIKALIAAGLPKVKINEISGRSSNTIDYVEASDGTLDGYKQYAKEQNAKYVREKETAAPEIDTAASETQSNTNGIHNSLQVMNQRLEHLETQIQELVDETSAVNAMLGKKKLIW